MSNSVPPRRSRRRFLRHTGAALAASTLAPQLWAHLASSQPKLRGFSADAVARDEDFWRPIQDAYPVDRAMLNLNNGGVSPSPWKAQQSLRRMLDFANQSPAYNMWRIQEPKKEAVRRDLGQVFGADPEELAIVRNATEALETVTFGLRLKPGDEVIATDQDYPRMVAAWKQRAMREGIVFRQIKLPFPGDDPDAVVQAFREAITDKTRVLHFSHVIFLSGQILPVAKLCALAREHGLLSLVDGAHALAHLDFSISDLGCDFYGSSLHKWLSAPVGTGLLYVKKPNIGPLWPLFAADQPESDDIRKLEQIGTHPCPLFLSIAESLRLQRAIGTDRKSARLRYLRDYWAEPVSRLRGARFNTSLHPEHSCGIANVGLEGQATSAVYSHLLRQDKIVTAAINHASFNGLRVTPHVYTTLGELDRFIRAMTRIDQHGIPG